MRLLAWRRGGQSDVGTSTPRASDPEAGVARGIDFHHVSAVLNFDLPPTPEAYIHRAGRWESWVVLGRHWDLGP